MASNKSSSDGEIPSDKGDSSDGTSITSAVRESDENEPHVSRTRSSKKKKSKRRSRYSELDKRFTVMENMLQKLVSKNDDKIPDSKIPCSKPVNEVQPPSQRRVRAIDSDNDQDDAISLFGCGHISPGGKDSDSESDRDIGVTDCDKNNNPAGMSETTKKCLFDMFGQDALVKKVDKKEGILLDKSQIDVLDSSYRCKEPNFLSAFSEENFDLFPVDTESEQLLQVPSLDSLVECCLTKRYGSKAAFAKNKGKSLFSQPAKMVEKIGYKGQQAARLGLVIQMYIQQSLGNLLQFVQSSDFDKDKASQQVKDIFAMSTKCLEQIGRAGAFHHISRRSVAMTDTALFEQPDHLEFSNLPLTGDGIFGSGLETLLKARKEKKKHIDDLIPDIKRKDSKRKFSGFQSESNKRAPAFQNLSEKAKDSGGNWNNFRIPLLSRDPRQANPRGRSSYGNYPRRSATPGRGKLGKTVDK